MQSLKNAFFCFRKLWMPFNVPNVGNCFVFNHLSNIEKDFSAGRRQSAFPGPFTGLKIVLDLEIAFSYMVLEGQGCGFILGVTCLLLLGLFMY